MKRSIGNDTQHLDYIVDWEKNKTSAQILVCFSITCSKQFRNMNKFYIPPARAKQVKN